MSFSLEILNFSIRRASRTRATGLLLVLLATQLLVGCAGGDTQLTPPQPNVFVFLRDGGRHFGHGPNRLKRANARRSPATPANLTLGRLGDDGSSALSVPGESSAVATEDSQLDLSGERLGYPKVPFVHHPEVLNFVRYFTGIKRSYVQEALARRRRFLPDIEKILEREGLPTELSNIAFVESRFQPYARTADGYTVGMWQLCAATARQYGLKVNARVDERKDVVKSTEAAAKYLADLYEEFGDWYLAAAAYNSGPVRIRKAVDILDHEEPLDALDVFALTSRGLVSDTTREFVAKIGALIHINADHEKYAFSEGGNSQIHPDRRPTLMAAVPAAPVSLANSNTARASFGGSPGKQHDKLGGPSVRSDKKRKKSDKARRHG